MRTVRVAGSILMLSAALVAQAPTPPDVAKHKAEIAKLSWLVGSWEGDAWTQHRREERAKSREEPENAQGDEDETRRPRLAHIHHPFLPFPSRRLSTTLTMGMTAKPVRPAFLDAARTGALVVDGATVIGEEVPADVADAIQAALRRDRSVAVETSRGRAFLQVFNPPLRLIVIGAVHIAQALAPMAALSGYHVTVIDPRRAFATDSRFPEVAMTTDWPDEAMAALAPDRRTAVVALTHDPKIDDPGLDAALKSEAFYIAALGSRRTHAGRLERLKALGHDDAALARIHGPAGLDIGAVSPAEIAISVMAEMTRALRAPST